MAVSTYQRARVLPRLLAALEAQTLGVDRFEVVIADNGSTDETAALLSDLVARSPLALRVVRTRVNRGPAAGRNLAWRATTAPVVAFTDDDCEPGPGWLAAGLRAMGGGAGVVVGRTRSRPEDRDLLLRPFSRAVDVAEVRFYETCNVFYRREDLEAVGGFDETFRTPGGEDTDLALRIRQRGGVAAFAGDAVVHHDVRPGSFPDAVRETLRWTDVPLLVRRHPGARRLFHRRLFWRPAHPTAMLAAIGLAGAAGSGRRRSLLLVMPWLLHRTIHDPLCPGPRRRWVALPGGLVIDLLEVAVMVRGSIRHRTVLL